MEHDLTVPPVCAAKRLRTLAPSRRHRDGERNREREERIGECFALAEPVDDESEPRRLPRCSRRDRHAHQTDLVGGTVREPDHQRDHLRAVARPDLATLEHGGPAALERLRQGVVDLEERGAGLETDPYVNRMGGRLGGPFGHAVRRYAGDLQSMMKLPADEANHPLPLPHALRERQLPRLGARQEKCFARKEHDQRGCREDAQGLGRRNLRLALGHDWGRDCNLGGDDEFVNG